MLAGIGVMTIGMLATMIENVVRAINLRRKQKEVFQAPQPIQSVSVDQVRAFLAENRMLAIPFPPPTPPPDEYDEEGFPIAQVFPVQKNVPCAYIGGKTMMTEDPTTRH